MGNGNLWENLWQDLQTSWWFVIVLPIKLARGITPFLEKPTWVRLEMRYIPQIYRYSMGKIVYTVK